MTVESQTMDPLDADIAPVVEKDVESRSTSLTSSVIPHFTIRPSSGWVPLNLRELWAYRELLYFLAWRDIKVKYKQTALGVVWAVLVPLLTMVVFNLLFGALMGRQGRPTVPGVPYAISTFAALVPWQLFSMALNQSSNSLVQNRNLITKIYFPRLIAPLGNVVAALVDFAISFTVMLAMIAGYHFFTDYDFAFSWRLLTLPFFTVLAAITAISLSLWLSAMNAIYRDVRYVVPFLTQVLMFVSPVVYASSRVLKPEVPAWIKFVYGLNPLASVMEGFRWALFGKSDAPGLVMIPSIIAVFVLFIGGLYYFRRMERLFADLA